jgi:hypothetical protein
MIRRFLTLLCLSVFSFLTVAAQENIVSHTDRKSFSAASRDLKVNDFEGIVPNSGFKHYQREGALRYAGVEFKPGGGERFGPGPVIVVGGWYQAGPAYETTTGAKLHWAPPNQPGNAFLDIAIPGRTTAVGIDVWTVQPLQSTLEITVTTSDGKSRTETISTPARPGPAFIGFTSESAITSLRVTPPKGQTGLIIDNFTTGKRSGSADRTNIDRVENPDRDSRQPIAATVAPDRVMRAPSTQPVNRERGAFINRDRGNLAGGVIAYTRNNTEIRLIDPDGSNDRQLWTDKNLTSELGIFGLAWKPDGTELAFSSSHEAVSSPYHADIYSIGRDGSKLRRVTNPPERAGLSRFPKGSVTVNISNFQAASMGSSTFIVYIEGADEPQQVLIHPGGSKTVTFNSVADFGRRPQMVVAMFGKFRWFVPGPDVIAGRNVRAPMFPITGQGIELFGAFRPVWRSDGSRITYRNGLCVVSHSSSTPVPGSATFNPLFAGKNPMGTCAYDSGPTPATVNQVIYSENGSGGSNIYQMTEGGAHPGTKLTAFSNLDYQLLHDLRWIPDGSGLLYSTVNLFRDSANIFRYDFATKRTTQVTKLEKEFARGFSVSPDSTTIVFEKCSTNDEYTGCDIWTVGINGEGSRLLVKNGMQPAWGK